MPRYIRNTVIMAKIEITPGTENAPGGATDSVLVSGVSITPLEAQNVDRNLIRPYMGGSEQLVSTAFVRCSFACELAGAGVTGTPSTAPQWGKLLQACGMAETLAGSATYRAEYKPTTAGGGAGAFKTLTIYWYDDGVLHKMFGAMGNCKISAKVGEIPKLMFDFTGIDGGISAANPSGMVYTAWKTPPTMAKANVVDIALGAVTYSAGALSGGTNYVSTGLEIDFGNSVNFIQLLSSERVDLTDRSMTGSIELDATAANEVSFMALVKANTLQGLGLTIGTTAGNKIILFAPAAQLINPKKVDRSGNRLIGYDLRLVPSSGNDEITIASIQ